MVEWATEEETRIAPALADGKVGEQGLASDVYTWELCVRLVGAMRRRGMYSRALSFLLWCERQGEGGRDGCLALRGVVFAEWGMKSAASGMSGEEFGDSARECLEVARYYREKIRHPHPDLDAEIRRLERQLGEGRRPGWARAGAIVMALLGLGLAVMNC